MRMFLLIAVAVIAIATLLFLHDDLNRAALINYEGNKTSGSFAGVSIGENIRVAAFTLTSKGLSEVAYTDDGSCPSIGIVDHGLAFIDSSWRRGTICVGVVKDNVKVVSWRYNLFQP